MAITDLLLIFTLIIILMPKLTEKGIIHLALPLLLILMAIAAFLLVSSGVIKIPVKNLQLKTSEKEPTVSLQTSYKNPFDKAAQYVNPFSSYKNPFDVLKKNI